MTVQAEPTTTSAGGLAGSDVGFGGTFGDAGVVPLGANGFVPASDVGDVGLGEKGLGVDGVGESPDVFDGPAGGESAGGLGLGAKGSVEGGACAATQANITGHAHAGDGENASPTATIVVPHPQNVFRRITALGNVLVVAKNHSPKSDTVACSEWRSRKADHAAINGVIL